MDVSTIVVLAIAIFIIVYRIKTWNDVKVSRGKDIIAEEVVEYKVDDKPTVTVHKEKKAPAKKVEKKTVPLYKKTLKADVVKNIVLSKALNNELSDQDVFEIKSEPNKGVNTWITLVDSYSNDERAVGIIYESAKERVTLIKVFDVKMQANGQFKVATSFSKALTVKKEAMKLQNIHATHWFVSEDKIFDIKDVALTLK